MHVILRTASRARTLALATIFTVLGISVASAQDGTVLPGSTQVGQPAQGSDMWTQAMTQLGLFRVHRDDCDSGTEAFVEIYTDANSVPFGFCMDKDEHAAGSLEWEDARQECLDDGKRLPEPGEFKFACDQAGSLSLSDMTTGIEWVSNFWAIIRNPTGGTYIRVGSIRAGNGVCESMGMGDIGSTAPDSGSAGFRCVR